MTKKFKTLFFVILLIALSQSYVFAKITANFTITGKVATPANVGIADVVVSDGTNVTKTNASGNYTLNSNDLAKFVFISIPADCKIPHENNIPKFYKNIKGTKSNITVNFTLEKQAKDNFFVLTSTADPQPQQAPDLKRFQDEAAPDFASLVNYYPANTTVVGISAGDIVWDMPSFYPGVIAGFSKLSYPYFQVIGNHDHDETVKNNDYLASRNFENSFGPTYYSFNRGDVHIVALDNIVYRARADYDTTISQEQLEWLAKDLSHVSKDKMIVVVMHSPGYTSAKNPKTTNVASLANILSGYKAIFISGHVHKLRKVVASNNITEYTLGPTMGYKWSTDYCVNGSPMGYGVFEFQGNQLVGQYYKATKKDPSYQMRLYPAGSIEGYPNSIAADVWNYGTGWTVLLFEDGVNKGNMSKVSGIVPIANDLFLGDTKPLRDKSLEPSASSTVFLYSPQNKDAELKIVATDNFGREYIEYFNKKTANPELRQVFFTESGGEGAPTGQNPLTWNQWHNDNITVTDGNCHTLPDLRTTYPSSDVTRSYCTEMASGSNNIYFQAETPNGTMRGLAINGIDASNYKHLELTFTYNKNGVGSRGPIDVYYWNDFQWIQLDVSLNEDESVAAGWYKSPVIKLPREAETNDLRLRFVKTPTSNVSIRLDDIWLSGEPKLVGPPVLASVDAVDASTFQANWENYPDANGYILEVSENEDFSLNEDMTTLAAWTFPTAHVEGQNALPNIYSANNQNKMLSTTATGNPDAGETAKPLPYSAGSTTNPDNPLALASTGWQDGVYKKHFQIDIDATGFYNLTLSSWVYSSGNAPKDMKVQYRTHANSEWIDVPNSTLTMPVGAYGPTTKLEDLALPSACDNQQNLAIRWVMTSSLRTSGESAYIVTSGGASRITNVFVKGQTGDIAGNYTVSTTEHTITGLDANKNYFARVRATDGKQVSNASNVVNFTTGSTGLSTLTQHDFQLRYSRADYTLSIQMPNQNADLRILDINGRTHQTVQAYTANQVISVADLTAGVYIVQLTANNQQFNYKFVK